MLALSCEQLQIWMKKCLDLAQQALPSDVPIGALVLGPSGEVLSQAFNKRELLHKPSGHAEILALDEAASKLGNWRLEGCTLFVTLEPCPMCASAIIQSRVSRLVFGAYDSQIGFWSTSQSYYSNSKLQVIGGILEQDCSELLKKFFRNL